MKTYKDAGVDVEAGYEAVRLMRDHVKRTFRPEVLTDIGGFGGLFALDKSRYAEPVLVSGTDGVGTKLKLAFLTGRHDTVGIDCVAMCVNDIACSGAEPLFFLDYIACGKNVPAKIADVVKGVAEGCVQAGCALVGGETAEMPGFYPEDEYDLAGFAVGVVDRSKIIDGKAVKAGDALVGLASSGLHSNGFSLVRAVLAPDPENVKRPLEGCGRTMGEELLEPTRIYVKAVKALTAALGPGLHAISHITGGGFYENIPRMLPEGARASVRRGSWPVPPVFDAIRKAGAIEERMMYNTFNMGVGMLLAVDAPKAAAAVRTAKDAGYAAFEIGTVVAGGNGVDLC
jgi:phosphoribosylformylglycinamidine cyclo-ligase